MTVSPITLERIQRVEAFQSAFNLARMRTLTTLPGNPYGASVTQFGSTWACKCLSPLLRGKNRSHNFREADIPHLPNLLDHFRRDHLPCQVSVPFQAQTSAVFTALSGAGLWSGGSGTVPCADLSNLSLPSTASVESLTIRPSGPEEKELYLDLFQAAFHNRTEVAPEYREFQWAEDTLPGAIRYTAYWDNEPVGMASFIIGDNGVGLCGTAGVLPNYRGRGIQLALLHRRIADAPALGCSLIIGGGSLFSTTHRNFERSGLTLLPTGSGWAER